MLVQGWIDMLHCDKCGAVQAQWTFSGDTDMATQGLVSAGNRGGKALVIGSGPDPIREDEIRTAQFKRTTSSAPGGAGMSLTNFLQEYGPADPIYACPWCESGEMVVSGKVNSRTFVAEGGTIDCRAGLQISEGF